MSQPGQKGNASSGGGEANGSDASKKAQGSSTGTKRTNPRMQQRLPDLANDRIGGLIQIGPVTTVGEVMNAQPGNDPFVTGLDVMANPTMGELYDFLRKKLEKEGGKKGDGKGDVDRAEKDGKDAGPDSQGGKA